MSVATHPGQTAFTSTPDPRSSLAKDEVIASSAALETEYAGVPLPRLAALMAPSSRAPSRLREKC